jgi:putative intracellular protease/amidase
MPPRYRRTSAQPLRFLAKSPSGIGDVIPSGERSKAIRILMVLTSHDVLGKIGRKPGFWLEEFAAPYFVFRDAGVDLTLASPKGGQPPIDPKSDVPENQTEAMARFKKDERAQRELSQTVKLADVKAEPDVVPFLVEDELLRLGAIFEKKKNWDAFAITDGRLITGQNPASSTSAARALLQLFAASPTNRPQAEVSEVARSDQCDRGARALCAPTPHASGGPNRPVSQPKAGGLQPSGIAVLSAQKRRELCVESPRPGPCQHHDDETNTVERLGETQKVVEPVGAVDRAPRGNSLYRIASERPEADHEKPKCRGHGEQAH